jgi:hypothetical protein
MVSHGLYIIIGLLGIAAPMFHFRITHKLRLYPYPSSSLNLEIQDDGSGQTSQPLTDFAILDVLFPEKYKCNA